MQGGVENFFLSNFDSLELDSSGLDFFAVKP